jgi:hypothetical protein
MGKQYGLLEEVGKSTLTLEAVPKSQATLVGAKRKYKSNATKSKVKKSKQNYKANKTQSVSSDTEKSKCSKLTRLELQTDSPSSDVTTDSSLKNYPARPETSRTVQPESSLPIVSLPKQSTPKTVESRSQITPKSQETKTEENFIQEEQINQEIFQKVTDSYQTSKSKESDMSHSPSTNLANLGLVKTEPEEVLNEDEIFTGSLNFQNESETDFEMKDEIKDELADDDDMDSTNLDEIDLRLEDQIDIKDELALRMRN